MHIKRVELENIKSYSTATFEFERGTTAITGENGAGKTTLIEAIAWAMFDLLYYKKDEFVTRGAKKGIVRVTFESGLDEREYVVYRDTGTGYYIYDPLLKTRIAEKKEDVTRALRMHLGVEPGTDLESLFRHAIGVPQGTFTAIFLATPTERKRTFDTLLKVEEYRRGSDELLKTSRFVEQQINLAAIGIARAEGELSRRETVTNERNDTAEQIRLLASKLQAAEEMIVEYRRQTAVFDELEASVNTKRTEVEKLSSASQAGRIAKDQREEEVSRSQAAAAIVEASRTDSNVHAASLGRISELEREREACQKIRDELAKIGAAEAKVSAEQDQLKRELEKRQNAHAEIGSLRPLVGEQERLEGEIAVLRNAIAASKAVGTQIKSLNDRLERLRESYRANAEQLDLTKASAAGAAALAGLQTREGELVAEIAGLKAALERDEAFQREIKNGLCPIFSEKCLNLKEGETLDGFVTSQFADLRAKIGQLQDERTVVSNAVRSSREAERLFSTVPVLEARAAELTDEGNKLKAEVAELEAGKREISAVENELREAEAAFRRLDNPKTRISILEKDIAREPELRVKLSEIEKNLERLESDLRLHREQLESYKDLEADWSEAIATRDRTAAAFRAFVANEVVAGLLAERRQLFDAAVKDLAEITKHLQKAESELEGLSGRYDRERHLKMKADFLAAEKQEVELRTTLETFVKREADLTVELSRLEAIREELKGQFAEQERLRKVAEMTDFIRSTLKEAAPLVARNYVFHVSAEANQIFREITGHAERSLKWTEDYGIVLEEGGFDRPFISLSGGEQMAAALSVRLALLKQLSDIRIAFFDEPTTNMDAERRENLAQHIAKIKNFEQLFVISHDDTFEGYLDNEIRVEK